MNLPATRLELEGRTLHIVGTAHISRRSIEDVKTVISTLRPDTVCVELDRTRYEALIDDNRWTTLDLSEILVHKKVLFVLASIGLSAYQRRMGERLGVEPGAELKAAVEMAEQVGARLVLADRDIHVTLKRSWAGLSSREKIKLMELLAVVPFATADITAEQVEELKDRDTFNEMLSELARHMPGLKGPLIDERDLYLMSSIEQAPGNNLVAVVGAGHVPGMLAHAGKPVNREKLSELPTPSKLKRALAWWIPGLALAAWLVGSRESAGEALPTLLMTWAVPNSAAAAMFTALAGGKLPSVIVGALAAPLTSLLPPLPCGVVVGLLEARLRRPTASDRQRVSRDVMSLAGIYRNPFTRVLWVAALSTLGGKVGALVGLAWLLAVLC